MGARSYQSASGRFTQPDPLLASVYTGNRYASRPLCCPESPVLPEARPGRWRPNDSGDGWEFDRG